MEQTGEYRIAAPRERVWDALNDPDVLRACIDGCEAFERTAPDAFTATVRARVGPVSATFVGELELRDPQPPERYVIAGSGKGGAAGFARGEAQVSLESVDGATQLRYVLDARVGGKLAQVGQRLVDGAARKMADDFFARLQAQLAPQDVPEPDADATIPEFATARSDVADGAAPDRATAGYEPSGQGRIWLVVFGVLALVLIAVWGT